MVNAIALKCKQRFYAHKYFMQCGASLIEVVVALSILAVVLMGLAGLMVTGLAMNQQAYRLTQASLLAESVLEMMRANNGAWFDYVLTGTEQPTYAVNCQTKHCDATELAAWDKAHWVDSVKQYFPTGRAAIEVDQDNVLITISYPRKVSGLSDNNEETVFTLQSRL